MRKSMMFGQPRHELDVFGNFRREIDRVFDQFNSLHSPNLDLSTSDDFSIKPAIDVRETESAVEIAVDLPGVKEQDIDVQLDGSTLTISGTREEEKTDEKDNYKIVERTSGSFRRALRLPFEPGSDQIQAQLEAGVLNLTIGKPAERVAQVKKIRIGNSGSNDA